MAHLGCLNWTPAEMICNAKAIGYDYVSIRAMNGNTVLSLELPHWERARDLGTFEHQRRVLETTKAYLKANGLE